MSVPVVPVIEVPDLSGLARASDLDLMDGVGHWARHVRLGEAVVAALAAEIERRSSREAGYDGLAAATGARTTENLVSQLTGRSVRDSRDLVTAGRLLDAAPLWLTDVASGVEDGSISVGAAAAITAGLGAPSPAVGADDLLDAAQALVAEVGSLSPEKVARRARELRDSLDAAGVADREADLHAKRFLRLSPQPDGMTRLFGLLDPESAALVTDAIDTVTAPRRGGPRFVDSAELERVAALERDPRTTDQLALDALVEMVRIAAAADPGHVFGARKPSVRVHVDADRLQHRDGAGYLEGRYLEGQSAAVSIATVERLACADGYVPVVFRPDGTLDVGHAQRLFTSRQRIALAAIWGGCAHPHCERPASWTEAHHAIHWEAGGRTDVANGVLLCRFHHLLVHNRGWTVRPPGRTGGQWLMIPPPGDPINRHPVQLVTKNPVRRNR